MHAILAMRRDRRDNVFARIGDSLSVNPHYLACFDDTDLDMSGHQPLVPALRHFLGGDAAGESPFARQGEACLVSQTAFQVIAGSPSRLELEVERISPLFALVTIGTNDVGWRHSRDYTEDIFNIVDRLIELGVVPLLSTIPPRADPMLARQTARFNAAIRGIAQSRQVPLLDIHDYMLALPGMGLRDDGVHLSTDWDLGSDGSCRFDDRGMQFGMNNRNLWTMEQLDRVFRAVVSEEGALDPSTPGLGGEGTFASPFLIDVLPFVDVRGTEEVPDLEVRHPQCENVGTGRGWVYRAVLDRPATLRLMVVGRGGARLALRLVGTDRCIAGGFDDGEFTVPAGSYQLLIDLVEEGETGEYLMMMLER